MKLKKETQERIAHLQMLEQNIQNSILQKQTAQNHIFEIDDAISEINSAKDATYKIIGNVMIKKTKEELKKDLESRKEVLNIRIKNIEKQEEELKKRAEELQETLINELQDQKGKDKK